VLKLLPPSISDLGKTLESGVYLKDGVYIQHIPKIVEKAQKEFLELCVEIGVLPNKYLEGKVHRQGIVGRFLDDCGKKEIYSTWYRFMCIDDNYKEWEQPYYTHHKQEGHSLNDNPIIKQFFRDQKINQIL
jgi:hypothetical protein